MAGSTGRERLEDYETAGTIFRKMKDRLPYVFRFEIGRADNRPVELTGIARNAEALFRATMRVLPQGYYGAILSYGMVVYNIAPKQYPAGVVIIASGV